MSNISTSWNRFHALFKARNLEFFRDRSSLSWNLIFPFIILIGFAFIFDGDGRSQYKVGVLGEVPQQQEQESTDRKSDFFALKYIEFVEYQEEGKAQQKVQQHALDLLVKPSTNQYWVNDSSPKGYVVEQLLLGSETTFERLVLSGREIRYLDWVVPGILGMNMMFSCLFGVGYVIVRYRKSSVLKRLKATPLMAIEFILAQIFSRLFIVVFLSSFVFLVCDWMFDFYMLGSYWLLLLIAFLGGLCLIALGLLIASRSRSEELTGGLLNIVTWPMMILSGVWFSLEGAPEFIQQFALILPLTHMVDAARSIMTEGATFSDLSFSIFVMLGMTLVFMFLSAWLFRWEGDGR